MWTIGRLGQRQAERNGPEPEPDGANDWQRDWTTLASVTWFLVFAVMVMIIDGLPDGFSV